MLRPIIDCNDAGGTTKLDPTNLFNVAPCLVKKVDCCENTIAKTKLVAHIGNNLSTDLASSTSSMLQTSPSSLEEPVISNALLRNLAKKRNYSFHILDDLSATNFIALLEVS